jgi:Arc/MetJ-type ribon-helix-helix transcriptional regulator
MTTLTIRISDQLIHEINTRAKKLHVSRSEYIRKSIESMNQKITNEEQRKKLVNASLRTRKSSMEINSEFDSIENE